MKRNGTCPARVRFRPYMDYQSMEFTGHLSKKSKGEVLSTEYLHGIVVVSNYFICLWRAYREECTHFIRVNADATSGDVSVDWNEWMKGATARCVDE